jgi:hypothetical protein
MREILTGTDEGILLPEGGYDLRPFTRERWSVGLRKIEDPGSFQCIPEKIDIPGEFAGKFFCGFNREKRLIEKRKEKCGRRA